MLVYNKHDNFRLGTSQLSPLPPRPTAKELDEQIPTSMCHLVHLGLAAGNVKHVIFS